MSSNYDFFYVNNLYLLFTSDTFKIKFCKKSVRFQKPLIMLVFLFICNTISFKNVEKFLNI